MIEKLKRAKTAPACKPSAIIQLRESGADDAAPIDDRPADPTMNDPNAIPPDEDTEVLPPADGEELPPEGEMDVDENGNVIGPGDPSANQPEEMPMDEPQELTGKFGNVKIYDLMSGLARYVEIYIDAYSDVETDQLSAIQLSAVAKSYKDVLKLRDDLNFYMMHDFGSEQYKKNMYTYLLFNKRFSEIIGKFRHALRLNADDLVQDIAAGNVKKKETLAKPGTLGK